MKVQLWTKVKGRNQGHEYTIMTENNLINVYSRTKVIDRNKAHKNCNPIMDKATYRKQPHNIQSWTKVMDKLSDTTSKKSSLQVCIESIEVPETSQKT